MTGRSQEASGEPGGRPAGSTGTGRLTTVARRIRRDLRARPPGVQIGSVLADVPDLTLREAYAIQHLVNHERGLGAVRGIKAALLDPAAQQRLSTREPATGQLLANAVFTDAMSVTLGDAQLLEVELAVELTSGGTRPRVLPAVEIVSSRIALSPLTPVIDFVLDNAAFAGAIVGSTPIKARLGISVEVLHDGRTIAEGVFDQAPVPVAKALRAQLASRQPGVSSSLILTGSCIPALPISPGSYEIRFRHSGGARCATLKLLAVDPLTGTHQTTRALDALTGPE